MSNMKISPVGMLTMKRNNKRDKLKKDLGFLIENLTRELDLINNNPYHRPNSCGIIQSNAINIDMLCAELDMLEQAIEITNEEHILQK